MLYGMITVEIFREIYQWKSHVKTLSSDWASET